MAETNPLPSSTVTFLFTDIEGSTRLWEHHPEAMRLALARHDTLAAAVIAQHSGTLIKSRGEGDSLFAVLAPASDAVAAACALQQALHAELFHGLNPAATTEGTPLKRALGSPVHGGSSREAGGFQPPELRVRIALHTGEAELRDGDYYGPAVNRCARLRAVAHGGQVLLSMATEQLVREALPAGASLRDLGLVRLQDLSHPEHVFQLAHPDLPAEFPPLRSLDALPNNLPRQLTSFIGREKEMSDVQELLSRTALLTLTGSGGCGKTRLALQVAAEILVGAGTGAGPFDGVWLVELAALADPALVPQAVASALGVREEPNRPLTATLTDYLRPKSLLLVLDNCEHLLTACAHLVETLLRACPKLRILASSREGLGIAGERTCRVPSLSLPDPTHLPPVERLTEYEAVSLFVERAVFSQPSFAVTEQNAPAVVQVCERLDGIPLAIELAAARIKALTVEKLNERLDDMFRLLTGGSRTALPRQQTLRALIDWSYDLLSPPEKALLRRLSVFAGGWTLEAAEAVCAGESVEGWEVLDLLTSLVDKSLAAYDDQGAEGRYRLLETVRQYGRERLVEAGEAETVRGRHRNWYLTLAEEAEPALTEVARREWLDRLEEEHDNFRAAIDWSTERSEVEEGLRLGGALAQFWRTGGCWAEGEERLSRLLAMAGAEARTRTRARALLGAGWLAYYRNMDASRALLEESLAISRELGEPAITASALRPLGLIAWQVSDDEAARAFLEECREIWARLGNAAGLAAALENLGLVAMTQERCEEARALLEESLAIARKASNLERIGWALKALGLLASHQGDHEAARSFHQQSLSIWRELGVQSGLLDGLRHLAVLAVKRGDYTTARALAREWLEQSRQVGSQPRLAYGLDQLAVTIAQERPDRAARLFGALEGVREAMGAPLRPALGAEHDRSVAAVRAALSEEAFAAAWAEGRALSVDQAVEYALEPPHGV